MDFGSEVEVFFGQPVASPPGSVALTVMTKGILPVIPAKWEDRECQTNLMIIGQPIFA
ncbi:hypothetical protein REJC140_02642 [Pseudorhizobium endolithicum]|uniref:Uncharacterized protein n=1 Tax=Pseudorhizobium endolithicum TaxID=1191678 RepID=A0ABM8PGG4_9HYPH|nr:hypothetical protein REQ54_02334 [Rhizobium sp. Q54]CAD7028546.1 hypothetical protein REJC140_02642 [Pseudorhizobium endolithicum]